MNVTPLFKSQSDIDRAIHGAVVVVGGTTPFRTNAVEIFDGSASAATSSMTTPRDRHGTVVFRDRIHVIGGGSSHLNTVEVYDGTSWTTSTATLIRGRTHLAAVVYQDRIYAIAGQVGWSETFAVRGKLNSVEVYDGTAWALSPGTLATHRDRHAAVVFRDAIHVTGGYDSNGGKLKSMEVSTHSGTSWTTGPPFSVARLGHGSAVFNDRLYIVGGYGDTGKMDSVEMYDGIGWSFVASLGTSREDCAAIVFKRRLYIIGGTSSTNSRLDKIEVYDGQSWSASTTKLSTARASHGVVLFKW